MPDMLFTTHDDYKTRNDSDEGKNESCYGSSFQDYADIDTTVIVNCALNVPLMLLSILGNGLVLVAITRTPSIRSNSMILLGSLAVSDLLVGVIAQPLFIASELTKNNALVLQLSQMTVISLCGVSLSIITAITLDRFLALHYHLKYAGLVTKPRVQCTLVMIWLTIIFVMPSFRLWTTERTFFLLAAVVTVVCLTTSTFCYVRIYLIVVHHQLQIDVQQQAVQRSNLGNNFNIVRLARSAKNTFVFYTVLILLLSNFCFNGVLWSFIQKLDKRMELCYHGDVFELLFQSIFVLLAYWRASNGSYQDSKADDMYTNRSELK